MAERIERYEDFWPYYLQEHRNRTCRTLHYIGSTLALVCLGALITTGSPWFLLIGLVVAYGCAWVGHFVFESNRPATFQYPLWSFASDWKMYALAMTGRLNPEMDRAIALLNEAPPVKPQAVAV